MMMLLVGNTANDEAVQQVLVRVDRNFLAMDSVGGYLVLILSASVIAIAGVLPSFRLSSTSAEGPADLRGSVFLSFGIRTRPFFAAMGDIARTPERPEGLCERVDAVCFGGADMAPGDEGLLEIPPILHHGEDA